MLTLSPLLTLLEVVNRFLNLRAQVRAVEASLIHYLVATRAIPAQPIYRSFWSVLFQHYAYCVGEADGVVRCIGWEEEHLAFADDDVSEFSFVDDFEHHGTFVLVEPFRRFVDVVVGSCIGSSYDLEELKESFQR